MLGWCIGGLGVLGYNEVADRIGLPRACVALRQLSRTDKAIALAAYAALGIHVAFGERRRVLS